jgi:hypothetical protein
MGKTKISDDAYPIGWVCFDAPPVAAMAGRGFFM